MTTIHTNAKTCPHCRSLIVSRVLDNGQPPSKVADDFRVTPATVHKWLRRFHAEGMKASGTEVLHLHPSLGDSCSPAPT
ncbi:MAG: helix-turn-helix domain-containing protein [Gallionellaceae bacterium]